MTYLRYPHLAGDRVVFVADDDVWVVDADGGRAERLTSDRVAGVASAGSRPTARSWRGPAVATATPRSTWRRWPAARPPG